MTMTGLTVFDEIVHTTNTWLHEITSRLGWDDRQKGYRVLRASLHALRDRMPVAEVAHLSAQLPILLRGVFFEGWRPSATPTKVRSVDEFLSGLRDAFSEDRDFDAEAAFREVISVMRFHISAGEMDDVWRTLPAEIQALWEEDVPQ
ncbi:MAG TPA: DUF2267 domain-containing protein [Thermohalobaculum sp.]|nr:DUF2267 domain-containing protein [Thermohalobaculum sp.]